MYFLQKMVDFPLLLLMVQKSCTTWDVSNPINNGINYQPLLVSWISEPSTVAMENPPSFCKKSILKFGPWIPASYVI